MARRTKLLAVLAVALLALSAAACGGNSTSGDDTGGNAEGGVSASSPAAGTQVSVEVGENSDSSYYMKVDPATVPAGPVTFSMKNTGTKEHEMVVLKTDTPADQLTIGSDGKVSEADSVGEISETAAGADGTVTLDLEPGSYVLVCNIKDHYEKGMYSAFTVS